MVSLVDVNFEDSLGGLASVDLDGSLLAGGVHPEDALALLLLADLEGGAPGGGNDDHGLVGVVLVHGPADIEAILVGDVVVLPEFFPV